MSLSVLAKVAEIAWPLAESYGIDPAPIFKEARIDLSALHDPHSRISQASLDTLWRGVAERVNDPCFALKIGQFWHPSYLHVLGYAWLASSSLRTALNRLARYSHIVNPSMQIILDETDEQMFIQWHNLEVRDEGDWHADGRLALLIRMCRANYGNRLNPTQVSFKHNEPDCAGKFFEYFRCPVEFGAERNSLALSLADVEKRLPGSNPMLAQIHDQEMIEYLADLDEGNIVQRVQASIIELLPDGGISDTLVAGALNTSNRTLQRKLEEQGTTFHQVLTEIRKQMAIKYLKDDQLTLTELSFQLGFSEMSAFSRAFKNWTGQTPGKFRQQV